MSRYTRKTAIQAKLEVTYGTNPGSWAATDLLLISEATFRIDRDVIPRTLIRPFMGGSEHLIGTRRAEIEFSVELAGSGAAGTAPAWGKLLRACGMAETITASTMVAYTPVSAAFESVTLRYFIDGVLYTSRGARGSVRVDLTAVERPMLRFRFMGFDTGSSEATPPTPDFTAWKVPLVVMDTNSGEIRLGASYASGTGAISAGTLLPSRGIEVDLGNTLSHIKLLTGEAIDISDREVSGSMAVYLDAATEVTWRTDINTNVLASLGFGHGTTAGHRITVWMPSTQRVNPQVEDYEGRALMRTELRVLPSAAAGNDELFIVSR